mmetsp:Transcript_7338/g.21667  ORF Transcript_7338/g.21667 Transcript_7338/m.21667 type:complete len:360 (-) Transcript_7338:235-1314(-)
MWVMRHGTLRSLVRIRDIAAAGHNAGGAFACLLGSGVWSEAPVFPQHVAGPGAGQGKASSTVFQQLQLQADASGWRGDHISTLLPLARSTNAGGARSYCAGPCSTSSSNTGAAAVSCDSSIGSSSDDSQAKRATKVCLNPECGKARELRHFSPRKAEVDGLSTLCDGCRHRWATYRRLVTSSNLSKTQAKEECSRRFDVPDRSCTCCGILLPASFFYTSYKSVCISCRREYYQRYNRKRYKPDVFPTLTQCRGCFKMLSATSFFMTDSNTSGLSSHCKGCLAVLANQRRESMLQVPPPTAPSAEKRCTRCQLVKPRSAFYKQRGRSDGAVDMCKVCGLVTRRAWVARKTAADSHAERVP